MSVAEYLEIHTDDEELARRGRLLNILLLGFAIAALLMFVATVVAQHVLRRYEIDQVLLIYVTAPALLAGILVIYLVNRSGHQALASYVFLLMLVLAFTFSDTPQQVIDGRSTAVHFIPIILASMLLTPPSGFVLAVIETVVFLSISAAIGYDPNLVGIASFYIIALIGWLSASSLKRALDQLRAINRELDQRVEERTRELAEALGRNQAILEGIADGVIVFDTAGRAVVANPAVTDLLDRQREQIVGTDITTLMAHDVTAPHQQLVNELLADPEAHHPSVRLEWSAKTLSVSFAPVYDTGDQVTGTVAVFRDYTREAELERMKSAFVSMVSHELRTPLTSILGYADMLLEDSYGPLSEEQMEPLQRIVANAERLSSLVNDLLDRARLEAGRLTLDIVPFPVDELITDVMNVMSVLAHDKGLGLTSDIASDVPRTLYGDQKRLQQILINLVGNAIRFTMQGSVRIRVYRPNGDLWALEVSDTGPGIPEDARSYIFEPFRQVDGSATRKYGGAGLGLSIVKQLSDLMEGHIEVTSKLGRGSTFTVLLPLDPVPMLHREAPR
jgi:PAS domain S-box-containing protein